MNFLIEPFEADEELSPPSHTLCPSCGTLFPYRSNKSFCSRKCKNNNHRREERRDKPVNATNSRAKARAQYDKFDLAMRMAERLYTLPPGQRLGYLETIIQLARAGHSPLVRDILTTPQLLRPDPERRNLFWRKAPKAYCTITQAANRYCLWSPWAAPVFHVVTGKVPDPPTGEVFPDGSIDDQGTGLQSRGWRRNRKG
jgi:hypothetical protein